MDFDLLISAVFLAFLSLIAFLFFFQRARYRRKKRKNKGYIGFYPSTAVLTIALQSLQIIAQPDIQAALYEKLEEASEDDENGDPDDPTARLNRQLKRIATENPWTISGFPFDPVCQASKPHIIHKISSLALA